MNSFKVLKITKKDLKESISGLQKIKPILQSQLKRLNTDKKQGDIDAAELGKHFDTAINSMITILAYMEDKESLN